MECKKCKHWKWLRFKDVMPEYEYESGGTHYCEKDIDAVTLKERKEFCNGDYFEPKDDE